MAKKTQDVTLAAQKGLPRLKLTIGHAQMYTFDAAVMATEDTGATMVLSTDDIPIDERTGEHEVELPGPLEDLNDRMLSLATVVISSPNTPGQQYSVQARLIQGSRTVPGSVQKEAGTLTGGMTAVTFRWWIEVG